MEVPGGIDGLRAELDAIDDALVALLAERLHAARLMGLAKRVGLLPILDPAREEAVLTRIAVRAGELGVEEQDLRDIYRRILATSRRVQAEVHDHRPEAG